MQWMVRSLHPKSTHTTHHNADPVPEPAIRFKLQHGILGLEPSTRNMRISVLRPDAYLAIIGIGTGVRHTLVRRICKPPTFWTGVRMLAREGSKGGRERMEGVERRWRCWVIA